MHATLRMCQAARRTSTTRSGFSSSTRTGFDSDAFASSARRARRERFLAHRLPVVLVVREAARRRDVARLAKKRVLFEFDLFVPWKLFPVGHRKLLPVVVTWVPGAAVS